MLLDNRSVTLEELMSVVKGPDFPTGGIILVKGRIVNAYKSDTKIRAKTHIETRGNKRKHRNR